MNIKSSDAAAELLQRRKARQSLIGFTEYTHPSWETSEHHGKICDFLEAVGRGDIRRGIIDAPPRHSKTELVSRRFPAFHMGRFPTSQIIISSYCDDIAHDISRNIRGIIKDPYYQILCGDDDDFPGAVLNTETTAGNRWETTEGGIVVAAGIGSGIAGRGADLLLVDDPFKGREEADSPRMRERAWNWFYGEAKTRLMPGGRILIIMTRWHEDDLVGRLLDTEPEKWEMLVLPAISDENTEHEKALWESRYPLTVLHEIKSSMAKAGRLREWNAQYQQKPTAEEGIYFKREWYKDRYKVPPELMRVYMASDLAVTDKKKSRFADWTIHLVGGLGPDGRLYMLDAWRRRSDPDEWIRALIDMVKRYKPIHWASEAGVIRRATEGMIEKAARENKTYFEMKWLTPLADKMARGATFKGWSSMGRIVFPHTQWAEEIIENVVGFPAMRVDDPFDGMSTLCLSLDEATPPVRRSETQEKHDPWKRIKALQADRWLTR